MRIGMMVDSYKPYVSGVTNYISLNKQFLERIGHEVYVFTFGEKDYQDPLNEPRVFRSPGWPLAKTGFYVNLAYLPSIKALVQSMDVVHVHHPFMSGRLALNYCRPKHIPIVFTNHTRYDVYMQVYAPAVPDELGETLLEAYMPSFCRSVNLVISPSPSMERILRKQGVDAPIRVIPNGVDLSVFQKPFTSKKREEFGFDHDDVVLVYTGRIAPEKNLEFLLHAFSGVSQTYPKVKLLVIGGGPHLENLKQTAHDLQINTSVFFTGMVEYSNLLSYMAVGDGFVTSSLTEVHPLSIIEAMAMGLPILGLDVAGINDTVEDGVTGMLSPNDIAAFSVKMAHFIREQDLRYRMGQAARLVSENYAIERTAKLVLAEYERLVGQNGKRRLVGKFLDRFPNPWQKK